MAYVKNIEGYDIKDAEARDDIETLKNNDSTQTAKINELITQTNSNSQNLASLNQSLLSTNSNVEALQADVELLKNSGGLSLNYNEETESLTFS